MAKYTEGFLSHTTNNRAPANRGTSGSKRKPPGGVNAIQKDPAAPARLPETPTRRTDFRDLVGTAESASDLRSIQRDVLGPYRDLEEFQGLRAGRTERNVAAGPRKAGRSPGRRAAQERRLGR